MDKKIITFFLASSINDLEYDRLAVGDFVNQLNNIYEPSGVFIKLYKCENDTLDHSICRAGSQVFLDEIIKSSDMCFVIFWRKAGEVTFHELEVALEANKQYDKPKIVVYFKKIADGESRSDEINEIKRIIDEELLHYHREYEHIDSLKLGIITQLQVHGFVNADLSIENNKVMCANNQIMTVERIPLFADNTEYTELFARYTEAVERCGTLQELYNSNKSNYKLFRDLGKAVKERDRLKSDMDELTENILNIGNSIAAMTSGGKAISDNIRRAIKCFDVGDYDGVLETLNPADIEKNIAELDEIETNITVERIAIVEEYRMRILALKAQARWNEVHEAYVKAVAQVENRPQMPKTVMFEYASFLFRQTQYNKCIDICVKLVGQSAVDDTFELRRKWQIYNLCGLAYYNICNYSEAEVMLLKAKQLVSGNGNYKLEYAESCSDLAQVYYYLNKHTEADALYNEALSIYRAVDGNDNVQKKIVILNMRLAELYYQTNKHCEAETLLIETLELCIRLTDTSTEYEENVADISGRLAHINRAILSHRSADRYFVEALKTRSSLLRGKKEVFSSYLEKVCNVLSKEYELHGYNDYSKKIKDCNKVINSSIANVNEKAETDFSYYNKEIDKQQLEIWCDQALQIRRKLASQNPEAYESSVAEACKNLAEVYFQTGALDKAEIYLDESLHLRKRLLSFGSEQSDAALAAVYCSLAELYSRKNDFARAEETYLSALNIYRKLSLSNELARTYNYIGILYSQNAKNQEADKSFFESLVLYIDLYCKSPSAYIDRVINTLANALYSLCPEKEKDIMSGLLSEC